MVNIFSAIHKSGQAFAEKGIVAFFHKEGAEAAAVDEEKSKAGIAALALGGMIKGASILLMGIGVLTALSNPVTAPAVAGYAAVGLLAVSGFTYGKGLEKGGDNLSGLLTFRNELRKGIAEGIREDFRGWRNKKLGKSFDAAAEANKQAPVAAPAAPAPSNAPQP